MFNAFRKSGTPPDRNHSAADLTYPNLIQSTILIISQILLYFIILYIFTLLGSIRLHNFSLVSDSTTQQFSYVLSTVGIILYGLNKSGTRFTGLFHFKSSYFPLLFIIPAAVAGYSIVISELHNYLRHLLPNTTNLNSDSTLYFKSVTGFLLGCIFAPLTEAIIYRGIILGGYLKNYNLTIAVIASSVLYSLAQADPTRMLFSFLFSLVLCFIVIKTGSLLLSLWTHLTVNTMYFAVQYSLVPPIKGFTPVADLQQSQVYHQDLWFTFTGLLLAALSSWYIFRIKTNKIL